MSKEFSFKVFTERRGHMGQQILEGKEPWYPGEKNPTIHPFTLTNCRIKRVDTNDNGELIFHVEDLD